jgi:hypothetical protein
VLIRLLLHERALGFQLRAHGGPFSLKLCACSGHVGLQLVARGGHFSLTRRCFLQEGQLCFTHLLPSRSTFCFQPCGRGHTGLNFTTAELVLHASPRIACS